MFSTVAEFYEILTNSAKRLEKEGPLLLDYLHRLESKTVLDIACGTGLHSYFLAEHGATVLAVDVSDKMLDYAKRHRFHPNLQYVCADMRTLPQGTWDMAICLGNSLCLLNDLPDLLSVFQQVARSLAPGGCFITQTLNYETDTAGKPRHRVEQVTVDNKPVIAIKNLVPVGVSTLLSIQFFSHDGTAWYQVADWALLRNWTKTEFVNAAESTGLKAENIFGGFEAVPYDPVSSTDILCVFRKPSRS